MTSVQINKLPSWIFAALPSTYKRREVTVAPREFYSRTSGSGGSGSKAMVVEASKEGGREVFTGSWGGSNPWSRNCVDNDVEGESRDEKGRVVEIRPLEEGMAVFKGATGYKGCFGTIYLNPVDFDRYVTPPAPIRGLSPKGWVALKLMKELKSSYRPEYFGYNGLGRYGAENPYIQELLNAGLLKPHGKGYSVTTEGRNASKPTVEDNKEVIDRAQEESESVLF